jgi:hypothetical protein
VVAGRGRCCRHRSFMPGRHAQRVKERDGFVQQDFAPGE